MNSALLEYRNKLAGKSESSTTLICIVNRISHIGHQYESKCSNIENLLPNIHSPTVKSVHAKAIKTRIADQIIYKHRAEG